MKTDAEASAKLSSVFSNDMIDQLLTEAKESGNPVDGVNGLLNRMTKAVLERALATEMDTHLGYETGDPAGVNSGNSRNGTSSKTVFTRNGTIEVDVPRDRNSTFEPAIVPKRKKRIGNIDDMILGLYSRGMTTRDIEGYLVETCGQTVSRSTISRITDVVEDEITLWQNRPLDEVYPILYVDGIRVKVRDNGVVTTKVAYLAIGVDLDGRKHALGCWIADTESAKFWHKVVSDLRNRGVKDILIACCDGLTGLPDAIRTVFPHTTVQTCVVHVIRNAMRFVSYGDRRALTAAMKAIYTAPSVEAAELALKELDKTHGDQYPGAVDVWRHAWDEFTPFLDFPPELRKIVYTTNLIESINYQLRKITKTRGHFPDNDAAMKLLYLGLRNITSQRGGTSGTGTHGWKIALNTLTKLFPNRIPL